MKKFSILFVIFIGIWLVSCAGPRSETMCYSPKHSKWIKCPAGFEPGDGIPEEYFDSKRR